MLLKPGGVLFTYGVSALCCCRSILGVQGGYWGRWEGSSSHGLGRGLGNAGAWVLGGLCLLGHMLSPERGSFG